MGTRRRLVGDGDMERASAKDADSVMLSRDYLQKQGACENDVLSQPLSKDYLESLEKRGKKRRTSGVSLSPAFVLRQIRTKSGRLRAVPFIGIRGSF